MLDLSPENERKLKSFNGLYIGTVAGSKEERATIAETLSTLHQLIESSVGRKGKFSKLELSIEIRDGAIALCETAETRSLKPTKKL